MKHLLLYLLIAVVLCNAGHAQRYENRRVVEITPEGKGKVDTRIDNIGYWKRMVKKGYVLPSPPVEVEAGSFNGTEIRVYEPGGSKFKFQSSKFKVQNQSIIQSFTHSLIHSFNHSLIHSFTHSSPDVPVTGETDVTQSENSVFIDPNDESVVLNSNNSSNWILGFAEEAYGADALYSKDWGISWLGSTRGVNGTNMGDPSTAIGRNGWWYVGRINGDYGQSVSYSKDQGKTWTKVKTGNGPTTSFGLLDKNHLWIDNTPGSPFEGYLYDAWTNFITGTPDTNQIQIVRSADQGLTWSSPFTISTAVSAGKLNHGVNIQTGPNGEVYVAWSIYDTWPSDETAMGFTKSIDGGGIYTPSTRILTNLKGIRASMTSKNMRVHAFPSMAVDNSTGPNRGTIYLVFPNIGYPGVNTGSDIDVYLVKSTDGGDTWSAPVRVNQDPPGLGKQHFFPWITCDPVTGGLCVIYYDDRNLPSDQLATFVSWSYDGGQSWTDLQVNDYNFEPAPIAGLAYSYFGDYIGIQSYNMKVYPIWTSNHGNTGAMSYVSPFDLGPNPGQPWVMYYSHEFENVDRGKEKGEGGREKGDGGREKGDGGREKGDGGREMGEGGREMGEKGQWTIENGKLKMENGKRETENSLIHSFTHSLIQSRHASRVTNLASFLTSGDSLSLSLGLKNIGDQPAQDVMAIITTSSPYVTVTDSVASFGNMAAGEVVVAPAGFTVKVSDTIPDNLRVRFDVLAFSPDSAWSSHFAAEAQAPSPQITGLTITDTINGNHNGRLDPGETVHLHFSNKNTGDFACLSAKGLLSCDSPYLTLLSDSVFLDTITPGAVKISTYTAIVSPDAPMGTGVDLVYTLGSGLYSVTGRFRQVVGQVVEDWETNTFTKYPWQQSGAKPWLLTGSNPWEGEFCAQSGSVADYQNSQLILDYTSVSDDSISFYVKTSSEQDYDYLMFAVDNILQGQWSGSTPWTRVSFPVAAGAHRFKWIYTKDLAYAWGLDRAWVDFIALPPPVLPAVDPGPSVEICAGAVVSLSATAAQYDSLKWTTQGDGIFSNDTALTGTYIPGTSDLIGGKAILRLTGYGTYGSTGKNKEVAIHPLPVAAIQAFPGDTACAGGSIMLEADTTGVATYLWQPGNLTSQTVEIDTSATGGIGTFAIRLITSSKHQCTNRDSVQVTFKDCTAVPEQEPGQAIHIYPNPAKDRLFIDLKIREPGTIRVTFTNEKGQVVLTHSCTSKTTWFRDHINTTRLPDGIYLVQVHAGGEVIPGGKVVIRR